MAGGNHQRFLQNLDASLPTVMRVAQWLVARGHQVTILPATKAASHGDWKKHTDDGDLYITKPAGVKHLGKRIEVKRLGVTFSGIQDWPFPDFIVCAQHAWERAQPRPTGFVYVSADGLCCATLPGSTRSQWWVSKRSDRRYANYSQSFFVCNPALATFWRLSAKTSLCAEAGGAGRS
jgi:hypothetical protein